MRDMSSSLGIKLLLASMTGPTGFRNEDGSPDETCLDVQRSASWQDWKHQVAAGFAPTDGIGDLLVGEISVVCGRIGQPRKFMPGLQLLVVLCRFVC